MKKSYLVSWSGGLDSTYLIYKLISEGHRVDAVYTALFNNLGKTERESAAIESIRIIFEKNNNFNFLGTTKIEVTGGGSALVLKQIPALLTTLLYSTNNNDIVALSYVMNDCAVSFLPEIKKIWNSYKSLSDNLPKLEFPLIKNNKQDIWYKLPEEIRQYTTWCEEENLKEFCDCIPCKRMDFIKNDK